MSLAVVMILGRGDEEPLNYANQWQKTLEESRLNRREQYIIHTLAVADVGAAQYSFRTKQRIDIVYIPNPSFGSSIEELSIAQRLAEAIGFRTHSPVIVFEARMVNQTILEIFRKKGIKTSTLSVPQVLLQQPTLAHSA